MGQGGEKGASVRIFPITTKRYTPTAILGLINNEYFN
jgi:hypothetical protein